MKTVILAGGKGRRLAPFTTNFPKPLMPVGERPILEILLERLNAEGLSDVIIATGHLEELIRAYFGDGRKWGIQIAYSREDEPLGTAGPLDLVRDELADTFLVVNGDTLSDIRFGDLIRHHVDSGAVATVALSRRTVFIDFGVVETDAEGRIVGWREKPSIDYLVSTGIYVFSPHALPLLPRGEFVNLPDFLFKLKGAGHRVSAYVHDGYWLDIGRPEDYERACRDIETSA
jgi:NDP-mannose synthase